eukprot:m.47970 g.47970  ORF g.47970 m.47970 type:complete len:194 (-) comp10809_c0_seq2:143-724(-)
MRLSTLQRWKILLARDCCSTSCCSKGLSLTKYVVTSQCAVYNLSVYVLYCVFNLSAAVFGISVQFVVKDVPMSADRAPSRCLYLWSSSQKLVIRRLLEHSYLTTLNMRLRQVHEEEEHKLLLSRKHVLLKANYTEEDIESQEDALIATHMKRTFNDKKKLEKLLTTFNKLEISALMVYRQMLTLKYTEQIKLM